jgi:hypothetical protein
MFSTCVARGIAAKLVYKTVGGKVETSLYCSTAAATTTAAANGSQKKRRKRPDNERRKMKREAWLQKRTASRPGHVSAASSSAAATASTTAATTAAATAAAATALEEVVFSSGVKAAAVAATLTEDPGHGGGPAAPGTASTVPATAAATSPRAWAWEKRDGLVAIARRLQTKPLESPETARCPQGVPELNLSTSSWSKDRELEDECEGIGSSPTYAEVASKASTAPAATAAETAAATAAAPAEEGEELVYQPQPTPPPWSCYFCHCSNHSLRELCKMCLQSRASTEGVPHVDLI